jgi:hypothetical protein
VKTLLISFLLFLSLSTTAQNEARLETVTAFLNAQTASERAAYMSDDYRSYFDEKTGEGQDKDSSLTDFRSWDEVLHPRVTIIRYFPDKILWETVKNTWTLYIKESNDFSTAIGFPGWDAKMLVTFNRRGKIKETIYMPANKNEPSYNSFLKPAVEWLQEHHPDELKKVYGDGKLIKTKQSALKWIELLDLWRKASGR